MAIPAPHRPVDLIMQGAQGLGQGIGQAWQGARDKAAQNAPGDTGLDAYINRMFAGEDPAQLGLEGRNDPKLQELMQLLRGGQQVRPEQSTPDVGMPGGRPTLGGPGQFSPSAGPQGPAASQPLGGGPPPSAAVPPAGGAAAGLGAPPPGVPRKWDAGAYWTPPPPTESAITKGVAGPAVGSATLGALGGPPPAGPGPGVPTGGPPPAQPIPGVQQPGGGPAYPRQQFAPAGEVFSKTPPPRSRGEQAALMPLLPTLAAAEGRQAVARTQAQARTQAANIGAEKDMLVQVMKSNNFDDKRIQDALMKLEGLDVNQQQFVMRMMVDLLKSQTAAGATLGAARTRAEVGGREDPAEKELRSSYSALAAITSKPEWTKDDAATAEYRRLTARVGELQRLVGRAGPSTPGPLEGPPAPGATSGPGTNMPPAAQKPQAPKAAPPARPAQQAGGKAVAATRYSKSLNKTQWLDAQGNVIREESGDKR